MEVGRWPDAMPHEGCGSVLALRLYLCLMLFFVVNLLNMPFKKSRRGTGPGTCKAQQCPCIPTASPSGNAW